MRSCVYNHCGGVAVLGLGASTLDTFLLVDDFPSEEGVTLTPTKASFGGGPVATALCVVGHLFKKRESFAKATAIPKETEAPPTNQLKVTQDMGKDTTEKTKEIISLSQCIVDRCLQQMRAVGVAVGSDKRVGGEIVSKGNFSHSQSNVSPFLDLGCDQPHIYMVDSLADDADG